MANAASTIEIELEIREAVNRLGKLEGELKKSSSAMDRVANSTNKMESAFKSARNAASALFAAISVQQIAQAADTFTRFANQIRIATTSAAEAAAVQKELYQVSQATGTAIEDTTKLYSRLRIAADQLGSSQAETIRLTDIVAKSLAAAGTSSTEASGALLQLAQALNSPKVQAEEFNSLIDGMPNLLKEVEKQLGLTAGSLKKFVTDGNLTNQLFKDAILGSADAINEQFGAAQDTIATSFTRLNNAFILLVGNFEKSTGFFNSIASVISTLAENMDELARVLKAVAVGFTIAFAPKVIRAIRDTAAAMTVLGAATKTNVIGALAALGFYIADVTGGLDSLMEKLGLTKDKADEAAGAIVDLTKVGGGGGANLEAATPNMPSLFLQANIESLAKMLNSNASKTEVQKEINKFRDYYNQTLETAFKEGGYTFTPFPDVYPDDKIIMPLADFIRDDYIPIFQMLEGMLAAAPNLTFFEEIREELLEQIRLFTVLEENAERTTDAIISGVSGAGPNASRATNIAQSKTIEEAAAKLILSNEKVAAAIDKSFEILFDTIDPLIDLLGDLISSINKLIGALAEGVGNAIENFADSLGIGPDSYYGGGGFIRDIETMGGGSQGGTYQPTASEALQIAAIEDLRDIVDGQDETLNNLLDAARESGNLVGVVELFKQSINNLIPALTKDPDLQTYEQILQRAYDNMQYMPGVDTLEEYVKYYQDFIDATDSELPRQEAYVAVGTAELIIQELAERISGTGTSVSDFEGISDLVTKTAQEQIDSIHFQNLTAEEQIHFRNEETVAMLNQQKLFIQLVDDEERRADLLTKIAAAEAKQLELYNLQLSELQRLNEEREREAALLLQQQGQAQVDKLLSDLERTFDDIIELVQGLRDQASGLLLGQYSTASATDMFSTAADTYSDLLAAALDPEATEENVKDFQDFVDTYLKSAQEVFKSSSRYQNIFDSVLADIEEVAEFVQATMPQSEIDKVREQLTDVAEEFGLGVEEVIEGLDRLVLALTFRALVVDVPVQTVIDEGNSDLIVEAVVTAVEDQNLSDTEIISIVTAVADKLSDTQIEEIVTAVAASGSDTNIEAVVSATASNVPIIQALVDAIAANIPVISVDVDFNLDPINEAIANLGATLQGAVNNFIVDVNQSSAAIQGETLSTLAAFGQGGDVLSSGLYTAIKGETTLSTDYVYSPTLGRRIYADTTLSANNREINAESLAASYVDRGIREPAYFIAYEYKDYLGYIDSYLSGFDYRDDASAFYQRMLELEDYYQNIQKIGFRRGGLVDPMDTIPAMLSPGEYILSPETVRRYGVSNLNRLNSGDTAALNATSDPEVKRLLAELIEAVKENDMEVNVFTDMKGQTRASIEEFRSELRERTRRQGDKFLPARYI